jgi:hypothetical protein
MKFLFGCILIRILFVLIAKNINKKYLPHLGMLALIPFVGFTYIYVNELRKTGIETDGKAIWWDHLRPVHAALYYIFAVMALRKQGNAYVPLLLDVIIGFLAFVNHHTN